MEGENEDAKIDREARTAPNIQTILMKRNNRKNITKVLNLPDKAVDWCISRRRLAGGCRGKGG